MSQRTAVILTSLSIAVVAGLWFRKHAAGPRAPAVESLVRATAADSALKSQGRTVREPVRVPAVETGTGEAAESALEPAAAPFRFEFQKELDDYAFLKKKVLLSDDEKEEKRRLMANDKFLRGLSALLTQPRGPVDQDLERHQNAAVDLLFEALRADPNGVASEVLQSVIQDASVEDAKTDMASRKLLAGIKGEILYQWSSLQPDKAPEMQRWLPGPVSQRIWQNVVTAQRNNVGESAREISHQ